MAKPRTTRTRKSKNGTTNPNNPNDENGYLDQAFDAVSSLSTVQKLGIGVSAVALTLTAIVMRQSKVNWKQNASYSTIC